MVSPLHFAVIEGHQNLCGQNVELLLAKTLCVQVRLGSINCCKQILNIGFVVLRLDGLQGLMVLLQPSAPLFGTGQILSVLRVDVFERLGLSHMLFKWKAPMCDVYVEQKQQALQLGVAAFGIVIAQGIVEVVRADI